MCLGEITTMERPHTFTLILNLLALAACGSSSSRGITLPHDEATDALTPARDARTSSLIPDAGPHDACVPPPRLVVGGSYSTGQLLASFTDPGICPSGWTALFEQRFAEGKGEEALIPLQPAYVRQVDEYDDLAGLADTIAATHRELGTTMPTARISLFWPCVMANASMLEGYRDLITTVRDAGYRVELSLLHHASYPAALHTAPEAVGAIGGWAHPDAPEAFAAYVTTALAELESVLPIRTVIELATEPVPQLMDGYIHREGKVPPGGRNAGRSLALAMVQLRDALLTAAETIRTAGHVPSIGMNIRPLVGDTMLPGAEFLDFLYNDWFARAMVEGCIDDGFDGDCERFEFPAVDRFGITFYGVMHASRDTTEFGLPNRSPTHVLARREFYPTDFAPDPDQLRQALTRIETRYAKQIADGRITLGVAELGFSNGNPTVQLGWLTDALSVLEDFPVQFLTIHAPLRHAEFSSGDWYFHLVDRCCPPELTEWGRLARDTLEVWNVDRSACR
jgi:hypothetical protein